MATGMTISTGDWVAIGFGSVAILRWVFEKYLSRSATEEEKIDDLRMDFETWKAGLIEREKAYTNGINRIERAVANVQSQLRLLVSGGNNKIFEVTKDLTSPPPPPQG